MDALATFVVFLTLCLMVFRSPAIASTIPPPTVSTSSSDATTSRAPMPMGDPNPVTANPASDVTVPSAAGDLVEHTCQPNSVEFGKVTTRAPLATTPATAPVTVPASAPVTTPATVGATVPSTTTASLVWAPVTTPTAPSNDGMAPTTSTAPQNPVVDSTHSDPFSLGWYDPYSNPWMYYNPFYPNYVHYPQAYNVYGTQGMQSYLNDFVSDITRSYTVNTVNGVQQKERNNGYYGDSGMYDYNSVYGYQGYWGYY